MTHRLPPAIRFSVCEKRAQKRRSYSPRHMPPKGSNILNANLNPGQHPSRRLVSIPDLVAVSRDTDSLACGGLALL